MLEKLLQIPIIKPSKVVGLTCEILQDNAVLWRYCILQKKGSEIRVLKTGSTYDLSALKNEKLSLIPIFVSFEGKGILNKKVSLKEGESPVYQVIPNAVPDNFCISQTTTSYNENFISVIRRDIADPFLKNIENQGLSVLQALAGSFHVIQLFDWFDNIPETICTSNIEYIKDNSGKIGFKKSENTENKLYNIAGESITSELISPFVLGLSYFMGINSPTYHPVIRNTENFYYKRLFVLGGWASLLAALAILMVNYFFYIYYSDANQALEKEIGNKNQYLVILNNLKKDLKQQQDFMSQNGYSGNSLFAYYTDRIAATIPENIHISGFNHNPPESKIKKEKPIEFRNGYIVINGQTSSSLVLNQWVTTLGKLNWIEKVSVNRFLTGLSGTSGEFELEIQLKNRE